MATSSLSRNGVFLTRSACKPSFLLAAGLLGYLTFSPLVWADGLSIDGTYNASTNVDSNRERVGAPEETYGVSTGIGLDIQYETGRSTFTLSPSLTANAVGGEGAEDEDLTGIDPTLLGGFLYSGKRYQLFSDFRFTARPASTEQLEESGLTEDVDTTQFTVNVNTGLAYLLDPTNQVTLAGSASLIRFVDAGTLLTPITTYGANVGWEHTARQDTILGLNVGLRQFNADDEENSTSLITDFSGSVQYQANERLAVDGTLGGSVVNTSRDRATGSESDLSFGITAGAGVTYQATADTLFGFQFAQGFEPSALGELQTVTRGGFNIEHDINSTMDAGFAVSYIRRESSGGFEEDDTLRETLQMSPNLGFALSREWELNLKYDMILTQSNEGDGIAHRGMIQIVRDFVILH